MTWEDFAVSDVWVDCDPGIDDAVMLAALSGAVGRGRVRLHGLSSVAGNMPLDVTTANLLALASYLALPHVPVACGADRPLVRAACDAAHVHGANGLGEVEIPAGDRALANDSAVLAMHKAICSLAPARRMRLVATGPLTNIALLLRAFPDDAARIQDVVIMGGSTCGGNVAPRAEYNIWADPEAAHMVFASGVPVVMCGLDVTLRSGLSAEQLAAMRDGDSERLCALARMLSFYKGDPAAWPQGVCVVHDAVPLLYVLAPDLFKGVRGVVEIGLGQDDRGETRFVAAGDGADAGAAKASGNAAPPNALVLSLVDAPGFQKVLGNLLQAVR